MKVLLSIFILLCFFFTSVIGPFPVAQAQDYRLPAPGVMVHLSPALDPPMLIGLKVHPNNPFQINFILDKGDPSLPSTNVVAGDPEFKEEATKLIKYFLASLTIPEKDLWVNLSPYEKDRIIPNSFGLTEMGRDLLAEDYMLKQITASLIYPEDEVGKKFWKRIYEEAARKYGTTNIPVNTFNKVWIVPAKASVYENEKMGTAYIVESKLKVMLEQDYLSLEKHDGTANGTSTLGSQIIREIVLPELTKEVNENGNFARLRQVYNSLILATWYKNKIKNNILSLVYADKNKIAGVKADDPQEKQKIYQRYLKAFKKGVYNFIKEDIDPATKETVPRKYFSGGVSLGLVTAEEGATNLRVNAALLTKANAAQASRAVDAASVSARAEEITVNVSPDQAEGHEGLERSVLSITGKDEVDTTVKFIGGSEIKDYRISFDLEGRSFRSLLIKLDLSDLKRYKDNLIETDPQLKFYYKLDSNFMAFSIALREYFRRYYKNMKNDGDALRYIVFESLKNAFVYGSKFDLEAPIYLYFDFNIKDKLKFTVFEINEQHESEYAKSQKALTERKVLHGNGEGELHLYDEGVKEMIDHYTTIPGGKDVVMHLDAKVLGDQAQLVQQKSDLFKYLTDEYILHLGLEKSLGLSNIDPGVIDSLISAVYQGQIKENVPIDSDLLIYSHFMHGHSAQAVAQEFGTTEEGITRSKLKALVELEDLIVVVKERYKKLKGLTLWARSHQDTDRVITDEQLKSLIFQFKIPLESIKRVLSQQGFIFEKSPVELRREELGKIYDAQKGKITSKEATKLLQAIKGYENVKEGTVRWDIAQDPYLRNHSNKQKVGMPRSKEVAKRVAKLLEILDRQEEPITVKQLAELLRKEEGYQDIEEDVVWGNVERDGIKGHKKLIIIEMDKGDKKTIEARRKKLLEILDRQQNPINLGQLIDLLKVEPGYATVEDKKIWNDVYRDDLLRNHDNLRNREGKKYTEVFGPVEPDSAQVALADKNTGGIDLTPVNMKLQTKMGDNGGIKFYFDPAMLAQLQNVPGFVPVIINIQPMTNLKQFLGLNNQESSLL